MWQLVTVSTGQIPVSLRLRFTWAAVKRKWAELRGEAHRAHKDNWALSVLTPPPPKAGA